MKLTPAQRALLLDVHRGDIRASTTYPPAKALVAAGLAEWHRGSFDDTLCLTAAGRKRADIEAAKTEGRS